MLLLGFARGEASRMNCKICCKHYFDFLHNDVPENSVHLAVIDPPYNSKTADWDTFSSHDTFMHFTRDWIDWVLPKLDRNGSLYVFNTPFNSAYILKYLVDKGMIFQNWIIWNKRDGMSAPKRRYANNQEAILFFTCSDEHYFNADQIRVPYHPDTATRKKGSLKNGKRWKPNPLGKLCSDVWHFPSDRHMNKLNGKTQKPLHPSIKPFALIERIIAASSKSNDVVLDCFMGSGTVGAVCAKMNRVFLGCDINEEYVKLAQERYKNEIAKQRIVLFE